MPFLPGTTYYLKSLIFLKHQNFRQTDGQTPTSTAVNANGLKSEKLGIFHGGAIFRPGKLAWPLSSEANV